MMVIIEPGNPKDTEVRALLSKSHALMEQLFSPEDSFALSIDDLCTPQIQFFVAREYDVILGCGALAVKAGYGEIKSMFTEPFARGQGVGAKILKRIELEAQVVNLPILRLETGDALKSAVGLYRRLGFKTCGPFGDYTENGVSVFMEKPLG